MLPTYPGVLRAGRIEWSGDAPASLASDQPVRVHVTILDQPGSPPSEQGRRMAEALERLAAIAPELPADPVGWQREDRPLPGRDE